MSKMGIGEKDQEIRNSETPYEKLKYFLFEVGGVGELLHFRDLADKLEKEGIISPQECSNIHIICAFKL